MSFGVLLGQTASGTASGGGGKRVCRFTVGTSTAGWTANDCDYLCDGTDDQVEINNAIQALPNTGGEIVILDGTYNITDYINSSNVNNITISGNGQATILKRMDSNFYYIISITSENCCIKNLQIDGNGSDYLPTLFSYGIAIVGKNNKVLNVISNNNKANQMLGTGGGILVGDQAFDSIITESICNNNYYGIHVASENNVSIIGNICNNNSYGIYCLIMGTGKEGNIKSTITGNICNNNDTGISLRTSINSNITGNICNDNNTGIYIRSSNNNVITGNTCIRGTGQSSDYTSSQYTISLYGTDSSYNLIANNNIMGKNYISDGGTSNTFVNNKFE